MFNIFRHGLKKYSYFDVLTNILMHLLIIVTSLLFNITFKVHFKCIEFQLNHYKSVQVSIEVTLKYISI